MSGELPPALSAAEQAQQFPEPAEYGEQQVVEYLEARNLQGLANLTVVAHGETMTLTRAFTSCPEARSSLEATIETLEGLDVKGDALVAAMTGHVAKMAEKSRTPEVMAAKKKVN